MFIDHPLFKDVSRETREQFVLYIDLLFSWQQRMNLIAMREANKEVFTKQVMLRHFIDSIQLIPHLDMTTQAIMDVGSGAGFPGLVLSLCMPSKRIYLVESDKRKCEFLKEVIRQTGSHAEVLQQRMETIVASDFNSSPLITSRACASVSKLLELTPSFHSHSSYLLLKGKTAVDECLEAKKRWRFEVTYHPSMTSDESRIVAIRGVSLHDQCKTGS